MTRRTARPGGTAVEAGHRIDIQNTAYFRHQYDEDQPDMRRLYEQAKRDQWNAATDIDWARPLDGDGDLIADDLVDIHGTRFWERLSAGQRVELNRRGNPGGGWGLGPRGDRGALGWRPPG